MPELGAIVEELAARFGAPGAPPVPLDGGITNRNYRVSLATRECVVRIVGTDTELLGIDRASEGQAAACAAELRIAPELVLMGDGFSVTGYIDAEPIGPERMRADPAPVARALRAFHDSGLRLANRFWVPELLGAYARALAGAGAQLPEPFDRTRALARRIAVALPLLEPVPCHNDLLAGNVLVERAGARAVLVDWEYAGMGHRMFDLGNLAVNHGFDDAAEEQLLSVYLDEPADDRARATLKLMRLLSDAREAAWGAIQSVISELDFDFDGYADEHFARLASAAHSDALEEWLDAARA
ncbi:MAG: phosphotransferase [Solirubrobacteraceae bacterium]